MHKILGSTPSTMKYNEKLFKKKKNPLPGAALA